MGNLKLSFYKRYTEKYINQQIEEVQLKIEGKLLFISSYLPNLNHKIFKSISGKEGLWEIRFQVRKIQVRIFFIHDGRKLVLLNAYTKKTQHIPKKELELAKKLQQEYYRNRPNGP